MIHHATITLPMERVEIHIGIQPVTLFCKPIELDVEYRFRAAEAPGEKPVFAALSARLKRAMALHDAADTMSLIFSPQTDLMPYLGARQLDWIEENLPVPAD